jgi:hypothetical protein
MKSRIGLLAVLFMLVSGLSAQVVAAPQYSYGISFLGSGVYNQTSAVDNIFGYQFTTNITLNAHLLTAPGGGVSDYLGGATYDLCGVKAIENALMSTSLNCGKIQPFVSGSVGLGRVQQGSLPQQNGAAFLVAAGINLPSASGTWAFAGVVGYGDFGPSITGQSNKGIFFNLPFTLGGGTSAAATQAKIARRQRSDAKKLARLQAKMAQKN